MRKDNEYSITKVTLLTMTSAMLLLWIGLHYQTFFTTQNGFIRAVLSIIFAILILLRPKPVRATRKSPISTTKAPNPKQPEQNLSSITLAALAGTGCTAIGIIFNIHQMEWLGILLMACSGLLWALPSKFSRDIPLSLFVLYWANPLPSQIFGQLQIWMQIASVKGSEWLLHVFNFRVWVFSGKRED